VAWAGANVSLIVRPPSIDRGGRRLTAVIVKAAYTSSPRIVSPTGLPLDPFCVLWVM
jgi:hypothetical protein